MYHIYEKKKREDGIRFTYKQDTSLAGSKIGIIPHLLEVSLEGSGRQPLHWHYEIEKELNKSKGEDGKLRWPGCTVIINLKPNDIDGRISLYEVAEVWGSSQRDWTPMMLYLRGLIKDEDNERFDKGDFVRTKEDIDDPIFTMIYMKGTVENGELVNGWNFPRPSSTNSTLLWPETLEHFANEAKKVTRRLRH